MADEEQPKSSRKIGLKIKDGVTNLRPQALSIVKFRQGVVDICIRASVAVLAILVFILGAVFSRDLGAIGYDNYIGGVRVAVGGWSAFLAFVLVAVQAFIIVLRFLNFAATFQYPVIVMLVDAIYSGVAAGLVLFTSFIPAAAYAAQFQAFASQVTNEIGQNIITTSIGVSGTLASCGCLLVLALIAQLVWAILWYFLKWNRNLRSKYEYSGESADAE